MLLKSACLHCGQNIEYPDELLNTWQECPVCRQTTRLGLSAKKEAALKERMGRRKSAFFIGGAIAALLAGICWLFFDSSVALMSRFSLGLGGAMIALFIGFFVLLLVVLWIIFPVFVYYGMRRIEKLLTRIADK